MGDLTDRIVAAAIADPTGEALAVMRLSMIDWAACGIAGAGEPVARAVRAMVEDEAGSGQASLFGGGRAPARAAALHNGAASHALDYDDTHFAHIGHVSVGVLPAVVAVAERVGAGMADVTRAALAGCEAATRMGLALGRGHYQAGFHQTATAGAFGATLGAGLIAGLHADQMAHALGLASTRASGLKRQFGTDGKPFNAGMAAANGVEAVLLAQAGMVSDPDGWDGPRGVIDTQHGAGEDIGGPGFLMPQVSHKFHACCHGLHAALEALGTLRPHMHDAVHGVEVRTHPRWLSVCDKPQPRTGLELKFSYRGVIAAALLGHDTAALDTFSDRVAQEAKLTRLAAKVTVTGDESLAETEAVVRVKSDSGIAEATHDLVANMSLADRKVRVMAKAQALVGAKTSRSISEVVAGDGRVSDLAALF